MEMPSVKSTGPLEFVFTLDRNGPKTFSFGEHHVEIVRDKPENLKSWERMRIKGPPHEDGFVYFIEASPDDVGLATLIWLSKEEANVLKDQLMRESARGWPY